MSRPNPVLKDFLTDICEKYTKACEQGDFPERSYQMGRAHGALVLLTQMGQRDDAGWAQWDAAFDAAAKASVSEAAQEVGVG